VTPSPTVSIVLPTYNGARYLLASVESCISQTFKDWELILVDDASTDSTASMVNECVKRDGRIRCIHNEQNRKLPGALNIGFAAARGRYFTWTSDDNRYRPSAIKRMLDVLEIHEDVEIVYADVTIIDEDEEEIGFARVAEPEQLAFGDCVGACFLYKREVHGVVGGYREECFLAEDYDFWLRASARFGLMPLHEDLYLYRVHERSLAARRVREIRDVTVSVLGYNLPTLKWMSPALHAEAMKNLEALRSGQGQMAVNYFDFGSAESFSNVVWWALRRGKRGLARRYARRAVVRDPFWSGSWRALLCALRGY
jgi:glycosyltransferase involved in cell wall biosynthesis